MRQISDQKKNPPSPPHQCCFQYFFLLRGAWARGWNPTRKKRPNNIDEGGKGDEWMNEWMNEWMDGWMDEWIDLSFRQL